jgi:hypothetical protein
MARDASARELMPPRLPQGTAKHRLNPQVQPMSVEEEG